MAPLALAISFSGRAWVYAGVLLMCCTAQFIHAKLPPLSVEQENIMHSMWALSEENVSASLEAHINQSKQFNEPLATRFELEVNIRICRLSMFEGHFEQEDQYGQLIIERARQINEIAYVASGLYCRGQAHSLLGKYGEAFSYIQQSIDIRQQLISDPPSADQNSANVLGFSYIELGNIYIDVGMSVEALNAYQEADKYFLADSYPSVLVTANLINVLNNMGQHQQAFEHVELLKKRVDQSSFSQAQIITLLASASTHLELANFTQAIEDYRAILGIVKQHERRQTYLEVFSGLSNAYLKMQNLELAIIYNSKLMNILKASDQPGFSLLPYLTLAHIEQKNGNQELALEYLQQGYQLFIAAEGDPPIGEKILTELTQLLVKLGHFEQAVDIQAQLMQFSNKIKAKDRESRLDVLQKRFALSEKEFEITRQKERIEKLTVLQQKQQWELISYITAAIFLLSLFGFGYRRALEQKKLAELANKAKSEYLATMSHELRTPINSVIGATSLFDFEQLNCEQKNYLQMIKTSSEHLLSMVNDTLDLSKIEAGKLNFEDHNFELISCIEGVIDLFSYDVQNKPLEILYLADKSVPHLINADSTRIRQILVNLISNSIKFTPKGSILINISARKFEQQKYRLFFEVKDTGIGMAQENLQRIFNAFEQADASITRKFGGSGLGLNICKRIIELMDGNICVASTPHKGTIFQFDLVVKQAMGKLPLFSSEIPDWDHKHIIIAQYDRDSADMLEKYCLFTGATPHKADNKPVFQQLVAQPLKNDLMIIDAEILNEKPDGLELESVLKKSYSDAPTLLLCRHEFIKQHQAKLESNNILFMMKPIKQFQFYQTIESLLHPANSERPRQENFTTQNLAETYPFKVLIVEDNAVNQMVLRRIMQVLGYEVDIASNGLEGLELATNRMPDLILTDGQMPEINGIEMAQQICGHSNNSPVIVLITGDFSSEQYINAFNCIQDVLIKPVNLEKISLLVSKWGRLVFG